MSLNNFFNINLPYGIIKNENNEWMAFNREYMPLGYNDKAPSAAANNLILYTKYKGLTEQHLMSIACDLESIQRDSNGNIFRVFLYGDSTNPSNYDAIPASWSDYFERLKKLSIFQTANK